MEIKKIYTDRSRTLERQRCPRARYWAYEHMGRGIVPARLSIPLTVGAHVHVGLGDLLHQSMSRPYSEIDVEKAVQAALSGFDKDATQGLRVEENTDANHAYHEQRALVEALLRAYHIYQLPRLLEEYEVLEIEREDEFVIARVSGHDLIWMSRADGLLLRRGTTDLEVLSYKTAASWDARKAAENNHDMQGLSEAVAVERRLEEIWGHIWALKADAATKGIGIGFGGDRLTEIVVQCDSPPKISGIKMEFLLKGERRRERNSDGRWLQYSPLIRAWRKRGITPADDQYAWRYEWTDEDGRTRRLGKGWEPFNVWSDFDGGVSGWISRLASGEIQPEAGDCLAEQFVIPIPYYRHEEDKERWLRQVSVAERNVAHASKSVLPAVAESGFLDAEPLIDMHFEQNVRACDWPVRCSYQDLCFGTTDIINDPVGSGLYRWRIPHHQPEYVQIVEEGKKNAA